MCVSRSSTPVGAVRICFRSREGREPGVNQDHRNDRKRNGDYSGNPRQSRSSDQEQRQRMRELTRKLARPAASSPPR